MRPNSSKVEQC